MQALRESLVSLKKAHSTEIETVATEALAHVQYTHNVEMDRLRLEANTKLQRRVEELDARHTLAMFEAAKSADEAVARATAEAMAEAEAKIAEESDKHENELQDVVAVYEEELMSLRETHAAREGELRTAHEEDTARLEALQAFVNGMERELRGELAETKETLRQETDERKLIHSELQEARGRHAERQRELEEELEEFLGALAECRMEYSTKLEEWVKAEGEHIEIRDKLRDELALRDRALEEASGELAEAREDVRILTQRVAVADEERRAATARRASRISIPAIARKLLLSPRRPAAPAAAGDGEDRGAPALYHDPPPPWCGLWA